MQELFRFDSKAQWVNKAASWYRTSGHPLRRTIAIDAQGRVCTCGVEFSRAETEGTYPIVVYLIDVR